MDAKQRAALEAVAVAGGDAALVLVDMIEQLEKRVEALEEQLRGSSRNSSRPPSSDGPAVASRPRASKNRSGRKPGGQPGHEGHHRKLVPADQVDVIVDHHPDRCRCGCDLDGAVVVGEPVVLQQAEIPVPRLVVTEHRRHRVRCPACDRRVLAELPIGVPPGALGIRARAIMTTLAATQRLSRRLTRDTMRELFGLQVSIGTIEHELKRSSAVLAAPYQEVLQAVRSAGVVHADETSWRRQHDHGKGWLWVATTGPREPVQATAFLVDHERSKAAAARLLGALPGGIVVSDRYSGYNDLDPLQQAFCWSHLQRDLVKLSERAGPPGRIGRLLLHQTRLLFPHRPRRQLRRTTPHDHHHTAPERPVIADVSAARTERRRTWRDRAQPADRLSTRLTGPQTPPRHQPQPPERLPLRCAFRNPRARP